jgi:hypothetical protein
MAYTVTNVSARPGPNVDSNRQVLNVNGTLLHPERSMRSEELTSDVLEGLSKSYLRVENEAGATIDEEFLESEGLSIQTRERIENVSGIDGRVRQKTTVYYLEEVGGDEAPSEQPQDEEEPGGEGGPLEEEPSEEEPPEDEPSEDESSEDESSEDGSSGEKPAEKPKSLLARLKDAGRVEENVTTSGDMIAKPLIKLIKSEKISREMWPEGFFEEEDRKTVRRAL